MSGNGQGKDEGGNALSLRGVNKAKRSPLAYCCGGGKKILHTKDWHREEESILSGFWPGVSNTSVLTRFISCHFDGDPEANVPFSHWADSCFQEDPDVEICLWEWTSLYSGKSPQGEVAEINGIDNMCNKTCVDVTFIESPAPAKQLFSGRTAAKNQSPLQRVGHRDIRSMFPKATKRTPEQVSLDHVVETKMKLQKCEEAQKGLRLQALKDKYDFPSSPTPSTSFLETLESFANPSLWENLHADGNGEWIQSGLVGGTFSVGHDGSYMPEDATDICLAGVVIYCRATRNWLKVLVVECYNNASNYRGKLLGALLPLLILRAATVNLVAPYSHAKLSCGYHGVISHSNSPLFSLSEKQRQADLIRLIKHL